MKRENIITIPDPMIIGQYKELDFNEFTLYYVGTKNIYDSNSFLNSLWRNFNESLSPNGLERCPWYYIPQKIMIKQLIITYFGSIRTQVGYFHIAVSYSKKGCINNIHLLPFESKIDITEINSVIKEILKKSKNEMELRFDYRFTCKIIGKFAAQKETIKLLDYVSDNFIVKDSILKFSVFAQDKTDAKRIACNKLRNIMNFLAVETNLYFIYESLNIEETDKDITPTDTEIENKYQEDLGYDIVGYEQDRFIDFFPSEDNSSTLLSKKGKEFIDKIISTDLEDQSDLNIFLNSCYHFREGIKREILIDNRHIFIGKNVYLQATKNQVEKQTIIDSTVTHYLSSIETATIIGYTAEKCESCGQLKFQINKRVYEFINKYLCETHGDIYRKIYDLRSLYLHTGISYSKNKDTDTRPLLDKNTGTGSIDYNTITLNIKGKAIGFSVENIREWTSYALRNFYKDTSF